MKPTKWAARIAICAALIATPALADDATVTIGLILPMTGPSASTGKQERAGAELYIQQHGDTVAGKKISLIVKDDTGAADVTKRLAEELIGNDHAKILMGFGLTPLALAVAPVATEAKVPEIVSAAATAMITEKSPYIVRTSFTLPQAAAPMAEWCLKNNIKKVVTLVTDYGPGIDAEKWFSQTFTKGGGVIVQQIRVPLKNPDFAPFLQRVKDDAPDAVFVFVPSGFGAVFMKQFVEHGLDKSGIKLVGTGDVTDDDLFLRSATPRSASSPRIIIPPPMIRRRTRPSSRHSRRRTAACGPTSWRSAPMTAWRWSTRRSKRPRARPTATP